MKLDKRHNKMITELKSSLIGKSGMIRHGSLKKCVVESVEINNSGIFVNVRLVDRHYDAHGVIKGRTIKKPLETFVLDNTRNRWRW